VKRILILLALICIAGSGAWWYLRDRGAADLPVVSPEEPLGFDETVRMRWVDEDTGEVDEWTVTKRDTDPSEREPDPLPEPDPDAGDHVPDESARTLQAMGLESWKRGEIREAMSQLAAAVEADPDDPESRTQYGRLLVLGMSFQEALPQLERAAELNPDDPQVWLDLSTYYERRRQLSQSWEARRNAEALAGDRPIVQDPVSGFWILEGNSVYP